jgi:hypothetical protein
VDRLNRMGFALPMNFAYPHQMFGEDAYINDLADDLFFDEMDYDSFEGEEDVDDDDDDDGLGHY